MNRMETEKAKEILEKALDEIAKYHRRRVLLEALLQEIDSPDELKFKAQVVRMIQVVDDDLAKVMKG